MRKRKTKMGNRKKEIIIVTIAIILQTIVYVICGIGKSYIHMDEAYSLGLASYDKVELQDAPDFYNTWHTGKYYEDYLAVQEDEVGQYAQVYENQKNDVHPPLYYLILRFAMGFTKGHFSVWSGIVINIMFFAGITIFMYLILKKLLKGQKYANEKAIALALLSSMTLASLTNVIYIRMYALATLNILVIAYFHMQLYEKKEVKIKDLVPIGISALIGSLTHYYYLFFLAGLYIIFTVKYIKEKEYKTWGKYTGTMVVAAVASLAIFPYSIKHMFFGYRGQGVLSNLTNIPQFLGNLGAYILKANRFAFNNILWLILVIDVILARWALVHKKEEHTEKQESKGMLKLIAIPTAVYFLIVSVASPWIELRYIMPICGFLFILVIYDFYKILQKVFQERTSNIILTVMAVLIFVSPFVFKIEPEVMYSDKKEIVQALEGELNLPTIFLFNSSNNRFLDDILLFAKLNESYVAKDIDCTEENIQAIFQDKDTSKGVIVFINEGQENDDLLEVIKKATGLTEAQYLKRLNACDLYVVK